MYRHAAHRHVVLLSTLFSLAACADAPTATRPLSPTAPAAALIADATPNVGTGSLAGMDRVNVTIPTQFHAQNPCAGGRFGEIVVFTGDQHLVFFESSMANGHLNTKLQWNAEGVTGLGQFTGFTYRATGVTQDHTINSAALPYEYTMINNYHIIGQGQATNMDLHETLHVTINANGDVSASVSDYDFACHGDRTF
jgi:hypothetical protein